VFDPTEVYTHDWMHCLFVDGVVNLAVYLLLEVFVKGGYPDVYQILSEYIVNWVWPARLHANHLEEIFAEGRKDKHRNAKHIKCQASDMLSLCPVLALFCQKVLVNLSERSAVYCTAFMALMDVVDLLRAAPRVNVTQDKMRGVAEKCLELWQAAWGAHTMIPKHHWMLHFGPTNILNCFCLERKHRVPKRYAEAFKNVVEGSSKSLLKEVTSHNLGALRKPDTLCFKVGLVDGRPPSNRAKGVLQKALHLNDEQVITTSGESRFHALGTCIAKDVVLVVEGGSFRAGQVQMHCEVDGEPWSLVSMFTLVEHVPASGYALWKTSDEGADPVQTSKIADTVVYSHWDANRVCTLLPLDFR
jgi:hypothetical protein